MQTRSLVLALWALSSVAAWLWPQAAHARPARLVVPIQVTADKTHTITFANLLLRAPGTPEILLAPDSYRIEILEELRRHGYHALGADNLVFNQDDSEEARFVLGGTIQELQCFARRHCSMGIVWELLDREHKTVVYKALTRAGEREVNLRNGAQIGRDLVKGALRSLLSRPKFVAMLDNTAKAAAAEPTKLAAARFRPCVGPELAMPEQAEAALSATIVLENDQGHGSGVIVSPDGLVLTAAHVVQHPGLRARLRDGSILPFKIVRVDLRDDIAVGRVEGPVPACLALRASAATVGEDVFAMGAPADRQLAFSVTRGIVSGMREVDGAQLIQTDASVSPGNSGGPLVDKTGRVVAIVSRKVFGTGMEGIAFGVPVSHALTRLALEASTETESTLLTASAAPAPAPKPVLVEDTPDAFVSFAPPKKEGPPRPRTPAYARVMRGLGFGLLGTGVVTTAISYLAVEEPISHDEYIRLRRFNDVGWVFVGVGSASVLCSWILPAAKRQADQRAKPAAKPSTRKATTTAGVGLGSVSLNVRF